MNNKTLKVVINSMVSKEPDSGFSKSVECLGLDLMTELVMKAYGQHIYIPSLKTFNHTLCVLVIEDAFKDLSITSTEGKKKAREIAKVFGIRLYQVKKILRTGNFTR